jgi:hypothetical protein
MFYSWQVAENVKYTAIAQGLQAKGGENGKPPRTA